MPAPTFVEYSARSASNPARRCDTSRPSCSLLDRDPAPEGDPARDAGGGVRGIRVIPRRGGVHLAGGDHVVVGGRPLPRAHRVTVAVGEELALDALGREVMVALDDDRVIALGDHRSIPHGSWHATLNATTVQTIPEDVSRSGRLLLGPRLIALRRAVLLRQADDADAQRAQSAASNCDTTPRSWMVQVFEVRSTALSSERRSQNPSCSSGPGAASVRTI